MKYKLLGKLATALTFFVAGLYASHSLANPYDNRFQKNYNQAYGDFPPADIDQQLQLNPHARAQPVERPAQDYRSNNPWSNTQPPTQGYPPQNYPAPNYGGSPYGGGPNFGGPWNNRGSSFNGPWNNRGSGFSPWGGRGGRDPFGNRGPADWFDPNKGAMSRNWDDMLNAPSRMGEMPGGWTAPSVSVPNPIDVGEEFSDAARDAPDQMDNFNWNNNRGRGYR